MDTYNKTSVSEFIFMAFLSTTRYPALLFTLFLLMYLGTLILNILMMLVIIVDSHLHTPMYFFLFNMNILDICSTSNIVPQTLDSLLNSKHSIHFVSCAIQMFWFVSLGGAQLMLYTVMAYDRYAAITHPLRYRTIMSWRVCRTLIFITWLTSSVSAILIVFSVFCLPFCDSREIDHFFCDVGQVLLLTCPSEQIQEMVEISTFLYGLFILTIPLTLIVVSYIYIVSAVLKIKTTEGRKMAFSTCSSHITIVSVEYASLAFILLRPKTAFSYDKDRLFVAAFLLSAPMINPLTYSIRNKAVKRGFKKLLFSR
ncbi:hypothetical protein GDO86_010292 [Hymenochirus boettgeri]|uniref:G-protein coupled receptors family 1 profile domain-containing protein n=1 Tax=Hymenochirus boettgeri TaxID=247094 RepID=A0A8T2JPH1_9PIPI|nr:hypothetical protein GDO86_010292 [Hymenochirus boettgeri]